MKNFTIAILAVFCFAGTMNLGYSHCQVPCGIYDDEVRIKLIKEHISTVEKAMKQIEELSKTNTKNYNQIVRWVTNKEKHAVEIQEIATSYFLAQRVKPTDKSDDKVYARKLQLLHEMIVYSMKAKQSTDLESVQKLKKITHDFEAIYFGKKTEGRDEHASHDHKHN